MAEHEASPVSGPAYTLSPALNVGSYPSVESATEHSDAPSTMSPTPARPARPKGIIGPSRSTLELPMRSSSLPSSGPPSSSSSVRSGILLRSASLLAGVSFSSFSPDLEVSTTSSLSPFSDSPSSSNAAFSAAHVVVSGPSLPSQEHHPISQTQLLPGHVVTALDLNDLGSTEDHAEPKRSMPWARVAPSLSVSPRTVSLPLSSDCPDSGADQFPSPLQPSIGQPLIFDHPRRVRKEAQPTLPAPATIAPASLRAVPSLPLATNPSWEPLPERPTPFISVSSPSLPPPPPSDPPSIPTIDDIIKSHRAKEAASKGRHPLPSAFVPPLISRRHISQVHATNDSKSLGQSTDSLAEPMSQDEAAGRRSSSGSAAEQASNLIPPDSRRLDCRIVSSPTPFHASHPTESGPPEIPKPVSTTSNRFVGSRGQLSVDPARPGGPSRTQTSPSTLMRSASNSLPFEGPSSRRSWPRPGRLSPVPPAEDPDHAQLLRSSRLNRILTLGKPPNFGLTVSLSDVGASDGHPVFVYLGLGGVRYLTALFDELASSLDLRLICIDRWGLGKTGDASSEDRSFLGWASVVNEVADQLCIPAFSILAHSAGAPYGLATALRLPHRVIGSICLLAPWVSMDVDGGYKWLRYVPTGVIKTAQAAEWKMTGWMMGRTVPVPSISSPTPSSGSKDDGSVASSSASISSSSSGDLRLAPEDGYDGLTGVHGRLPSDSHSRSGSSGPASVLRRRTSRILAGVFREGALNQPTSSASYRKLASPSIGGVSAEKEGEPALAPSASRVLSAASPSISSSSSPGPSSGRVDLGTALLRASHAENQGATADLLAIMERSGARGFAYTDIQAPVRIWYGSSDEKISEKSVRWMERMMPNCSLKIVAGGHNLTSNPKVMIDVLEALAAEARAQPRERRFGGRRRSLVMR